MTLELRTARLVLRPVAENDLDVLLRIRNASPVVVTTRTGEALPRERMAEQLARRCTSWRERGFGSWLVLLDGEPVAFVEVTPIGEGSGNAAWLILNTLAHNLTRWTTRLGLAWDT